MKISTKGRYGLRILMDIALHQADGPVPLNEIAGRQGISSKYLWQIVNPMRTSGLLTVQRGAFGGYALAKPEDQITLYDIVSVLEGSVSVVDCITTPEICSTSGNCAARSIWSDVNDVLAETLRGITLADALDRHRATSPNYDFMI
jgi:Rrf2 family protein